MTPLLWLLLAGASQEALAYRVRDLRTEPTESFFLSAELAAVGSKALASIGLPGLGVEPWISDGSPEGTVLLASLAPGQSSSSPQELANLGDLLFFAAFVPGSREGLWRTDGTPEGTQMLLAGSSPRALGVLDGVLYFAGSDPAHGRELWRSDGTTQGTWLVSDVLPGPQGGVCEYTGAVAGELLFFCGLDAANRGQLWVSDGTRAGTRAVEAGQPAFEGRRPNSFLSAGGRAYFAGWDPFHGWELWTSDGTAAGTRLVADLVLGPDDSYARPAAEAGDRAIFVVQSPDSYGPEPWSTDGTEEGTTRLAEVQVQWPYATVGEGFPELNDRVVFFGWTSQLGGEPWTTDGTPQGTFPLGDLAPGTGGSINWLGAGIGHDGAYFCAWAGEGDRELWRTDGKPEGTVRVAPADGCEDVRDSVVVDGETLFNLCWWYYCGPHTKCDQCRLWRTDGSLQGTQPFWSEQIELSSSQPFALTASPAGVLFGAQTDPPATEYDDWLFRSDGTEAGTVLLSPASGDPVDFWGEVARTSTGHLVLAGRTDATGSEPWRTDGDTLELVRDLNPGWEGSGPDHLTTVGAWVYFAASDGQIGPEPWRSDGTADGTTLILDLAPGDWSSEPHGFVAAMGRAWFGAENLWVGEELWESGGTPETTFVHDLARGGPPASTHPEQITELDAVRGRLVFRSGRELYAYLPASRALTLLKSTSPSSRYGHDLALATRGTTLFFIDEDEHLGCELWSSDGTRSGTRLVAPIGNDSGIYSWSRLCPQELTVFGGHLYFSSCDAEAGCELWTSDGTASGTGRLGDLEPGAASFLPTNLTPIEGRMYFSGCREEIGCEPWVTDGTIEGTRLLADVAPGPLASDPSQFTLSGPLLYFAADDGTGAELWAMPLEIFYDGFETGTTARWGGSGG